MDAALGGLAQQKWLEARSRAAQKSANSSVDEARAAPFSCGYSSSDSDSPTNLQSHLASYSSASDDDEAAGRVQGGCPAGRVQGDAGGGSRRQLSPDCTEKKGARGDGEDCSSATTASSVEHGESRSNNAARAIKRRKLPQSSDALNSAGVLTV
jgi:hypothetical protein